MILFLMSTWLAEYALALAPSNQRHPKQFLTPGRATEHAYGRTHEEAFHAPGNSKADAGAALSSGNANAHRGLYNEAYLNEGHFNSDAALQNDLRVGR